MCTAGLSLSLSHGFLTGLQLCAGTESWSLLQREQTGRWGAAEEGGMSHHEKEGSDISQLPKAPASPATRCQMHARGGQRLGCETEPPSTELSLLAVFAQ